MANSADCSSFTLENNDCVLYLLFEMTRALERPAKYLYLPSCEPSASNQTPKLCQ